MAETQTAPDRPAEAVADSPPAGETPAEADGWGVWLAAAISGAMMFAAFEPLGWAPLGWLAVVPLCVLARRPSGTRVLWPAMLGGLCWTVPQLAWMRLAHPMMFVAWLALAFYMAAYFPLFVGLTRRAHRFVPLPFAAAVVWMGLELVRCRLMTGFPWYLLGHSQHDWTTLIQIADIGGATLISGLMAAFGGIAAMSVPPSLLGGCRLLPAREATAPASSIVGFAVVFLTCLAYGRVRLSQADFQPGPRVAVVQGNFTSSTKHDPSQAGRMVAAHGRLTQIATRSQPDVIVWPETMLPYPLLEADDSLTSDQLAAVSPFPAEAWADRGLTDFIGNLGLRSGASLVIGAARMSARADRVFSFNSAVYVTPDGDVSASYDKRHRVPFGEYIPLSDWITVLRAISFVGGGLDAGENLAAFEHPRATLIPLICFEDTVPELAADAVRDAADGPRRGVLLNLTNDGWFHGSSELDQHLITAAFRCVETRTPMVRSVNTGISAFIDGNGVIREPDVMLNADAAIEGDADPVATTMRDASGRFRRQFHGVLVADVSLDGRTSVYLVIGDLISMLCGLVCGGLLVSAVIERRRRKTAPSGDPAA